jgi:hypothetical protein
MYPLTTVIAIVSTMQIEVFSPEFLQLIQQVGFPIGVNIALILLIVWMIRRDQKRETKMEGRYSQMVDKLFETINKTTERHEQTVDNIGKELKLLTTEFGKIGLRMDRYTGIIDEQLEAKRKLMIFKNRDELEELREEHQHQKRAE